MPAKSRAGRTLPRLHARLSIFEGGGLRHMHERGHGRPPRLTVQSSHADPQHTSPVVGRMISNSIAPRKSATTILESTIQDDRPSTVIRHPVCRRHGSRPFAVRRHPLKNRTNSGVMPAAVSLLSRAQAFSRAEHFPQFVQLSASRQSRTSGQSGEAPSR